ncbi:MAG: hypothetical protein ACI9H6_000523 [Patiriisocius sp.]|jgi:hypothetical protein
MNIKLVLLAACVAVAAAGGALVVGGGLSSSSTETLTQQPGVVQPLPLQRAPQNDPSQVEAIEGLNLRGN